MKLTDAIRNPAKAVTSTIRLRRAMKEASDRVADPNFEPASMEQKMIESADLIAKGHGLKVGSPEYNDLKCDIVIANAESALQRGDTASVDKGLDLLTFYYGQPDEGGSPQRLGGIPAELLDRMQARNQERIEAGLKPLFTDDIVSNLSEKLVGQQAFDNTERLARYNHIMATRRERYPSDFMNEVLSASDAERQGAIESLSYERLPDPSDTIDGQS